MFRTPFSCGYYQYTENINLARTKIISSCLLLLEAHGLEFYYRPLESSTMVTHAYNKQLLDEVEHDIMNYQDNTDTRF